MGFPMLTILLILTLLLMMDVPFSFGEPEPSIEVKWFRVGGDLISLKSDPSNSLEMFIGDKMKRHYSGKRNLNKSMNMLKYSMDSDDTNNKVSSRIMRLDIIDHFAMSTIDNYLQNRNFRSCGLMKLGNRVALVNCPGLLTVISLDGVQRINCQRLKDKAWEGPVMFTNAICKQSIVFPVNCNNNNSSFFKRMNCKEVIDLEENKTPLVVLIILVTGLSLMFVSLIYSIVRLAKLSKTHKITLWNKHFAFTTFKTYSGDGVKVLLKEEKVNLPNLEEVKTTFHPLKMLLVLLCFWPIKVESYDLQSLVNINNKTWKYMIEMQESESIQVGAHLLKVESESNVARITKEFYTYDWSLNMRNGYSCIQKDCDVLMTCREGKLPFVEATLGVKNYLKLGANSTSYATCQRMRAYCMFSNGCFIIGYEIVLDEKKKYSVYGIHRQGVVGGQIKTPPGCFLDSKTTRTGVDLSGLYLVIGPLEDKYLCHPKYFTHHPLPRSLGDLKIDDQGTINFIHDHIVCAADTWDYVYCSYPNSFISNIDSYCTKVGLDNNGLDLTIESDTLRWSTKNSIQFKLTCDRDLQLTYSESYCSSFEITVWDTNDLENDLLLSFVGKSDNNKGIFTLPSSVHSEVSMFLCNNQPQHTIIFDLKSLESSGIPFTLHVHNRSLVPDEDRADTHPPDHSDNGFHFPTIGWDLTLPIIGGSSLLVVIIILLILCLLIRK